LAHAGPRARNDHDLVFKLCQKTPTSRRFNFERHYDSGVSLLTIADRGRASVSAAGPCHARACSATALNVCVIHVTIVAVSLMIVKRCVKS